MTASSANETADDSAGGIRPRARALRPADTASADVLTALMTRIGSHRIVVLENPNARLAVNASRQSAVTSKICNI
jgi:hypothetical protein